MVIWMTIDVDEGLIDVDEGLIHGKRNHWIESYHNVWHVTCVTQHDGYMH